MKVSLATFLCSVALLTARTADAQTYTRLILGGGSRHAWGAWQVSADGSVITGQSEDAERPPWFSWPTLWARQGDGSYARSSLDVPPDHVGGEAWGASANGSVIVGYSESPVDYHALVWTRQGDGSYSVATLVSGESAQGVSGDGAVAVGSLLGGGPAVWTRGGDGTYSSAVLVPTPSGGNASGVSGDGQVVVGDEGGYAAAWVRQGDGTYAKLPLDPGCQGFDANNDGTVIVGFCPEQGVAWTREIDGSYTMRPVGFSVYAFGVSGDGQIVAGVDEFGFAAAWKREIDGSYTHISLDGIGGDLSWSSAYGVNGDGTVIVGFDTWSNAVAWIADAPPGCSSLPDGSACNDGNACTQTDTCQAGSCAGANPVVCSAPECHDVGVCDPATGVCSDPLKPQGSACADDGNACTVDQCDGAGSCVHPAGNAGTLCRAAAGECDVAEACDGSATTCPANGFVPDGTLCTDDGYSCTSNTCQSGVCAGATNNPNNPACPATYTCDPPQSVACPASYRSPTDYCPSPKTTCDGTFDTATGCYKPDADADGIANALDKIGISPFKQSYATSSSNAANDYCLGGDTRITFNRCVGGCTPQHVVTVTPWSANIDDGLKIIVSGGPATCTLSPTPSGHASITLFCWNPVTMAYDSTVANVCNGTYQKFCASNHFFVESGAGVFYAGMYVVEVPAGYGVAFTETAEGQELTAAETNPGPLAVAVEGGGTVEVGAGEPSPPVVLDQAWATVVAHGRSYLRQQGAIVDSLLDNIALKLHPADHPCVLDAEASQPRTEVARYIHENCPFMGTGTTDTNGRATLGSLAPMKVMATGHNQDDPTLYYRSNARTVQVGETTSLQLRQFVVVSSWYAYPMIAEELWSGADLLTLRYPDYALWNLDYPTYYYPIELESTAGTWTIDVCAEMPPGYAIVGEPCQQTLVSGESKLVLFEAMDLESPEPELSLDLHVQPPAKRGLGHGKVITHQIKVPGYRSHLGDRKDHLAIPGVRQSK